MIPSDPIVKLSVALLGAAFAAGAAAFSVRQTRADLKGLSKKNMRIVALLVRWADTDEKRNQCADLIEPK